MQVIYFAYGSNMSTRRLQLRAPSATSLGAGTLDSHRLAFHKISDRDGSGKCGIVESRTDRVMGVLFRLDQGDKEDLDRHEGLGNGYAQKRVTVIDRLGELVGALTYYATITDPNLKPFSWYLRHVIEGAREAGLPGLYLQMLMQAEAVEDKDEARSRRELSIYNNGKKGSGFIFRSGK